MVALLAITVGLVLWDRRPESLTGPLLTAASFAAVLTELDPLFHRSPLALTFAIVASPLVVALFVHLFLGFPTGRLDSRLERGFVTGTYAFELAFALLFLLFYDARYYVVTGIRVQCLSCGTAPLTNIGWRDLTGAGRLHDGITIGVIAIFAALVAAKLVRAAPGPRRVLLPFGLAALVLAAYGTIVFGLDLTGSSTNFWTSSRVFWSETLAVLAIPVALAAGLLWGRTSRAAVADLVLDLERTPPRSA